MRQHPRLSATGRFWPAVALVLISLLWLTRDLAPWAAAVAWAGAVVGVLVAVHAGWRYLRGESR